VDSTRARISADRVLLPARRRRRGTPARSKVRAGLGDFARAIGNVARRGAKTPRG